MIARRATRRILRTAVGAMPASVATRALAVIERGRASARTAVDGECCLVFAADALVASYRSALLTAARVAAEANLRPVILRCRGCLGTCVSKRFSGQLTGTTTNRPDATCAQCALAGVLDPAPGTARMLWIDDLVPSEQQRQDDALLASLTDASLESFEIDGLPAGAICASELLHNLRVLRYDATQPTHVAVMRSKLGAALRSLRAYEHAARIDPPAVFVHFSDYSYHLLPAMAARRAGVRIVNLTHPALFNITHSRLIALPRTTLEHCYEMVRAWPQFETRALPAARVELLARDQIFRMTGGGSHVFSPVRGADPAALRTRLGIEPDRPIVAAFTSSPDELNSIELWSRAVGIDLGEFPDPFASQVQWLEATATHLASQPRAPMLVVRIHPREGSRGGPEAGSEHLRLLRNHLEGRDDVRVIWPDEACSSYDLGEIADCVCTSWSSLGQEFARTGAAVVRAFGMKVPIPLDVFSRYALTRAGYLDAIDQAIVSTPSLESVTLAYRWHNLEYLGSALDPSQMSEGSRQWPGRGALADLIMGRQEVMEAARAALPSVNDAEAVRAEQLAVLAALRRLLAVLMGGATVDAAYMSVDARAPEPSPTLLEHEPVIREDGAVEWRIAGQRLERRSALVRRLATLVRAAARSRPQTVSQSVD